MTFSSAPGTVHPLAPVPDLVLTLFTEEHLTRDVAPNKVMATTFSRVVTGNATPKEAAEVNCSCTGTRGVTVGGLLGRSAQNNSCDPEHRDAERGDTREATQWQSQRTWR